MGLIGVKLRRDLSAAWARLALMVIAISVSLTAFAAVLFAWAASARETASAYASTEPASATILLDKPISVAQMAAVAAKARELPGVIEAAGRTQFTVDVSVNGEPRPIPLQVFAAPAADPMRIARIFPAQRAWPPAPDELFIGRDTLSLLDVAIGDTVTLTLPSGETTDLRVADTVYDPSLSPSPQEQTGRAYVSAVSTLDQLKIQVPGRDRDVIAARAGEIGRWLQDEFGLTVREVQVPPPYAHPHQWQADALLAALLAGGAASLVLSAVLVAVMLNNLFTQQIPQIGIMKAIGARSGRIARLYLSMTLIVALAATLLALIPAILLGRLAVQTFLGFLGIEPASLAAPGWTYLVVAGAGLVLPPLMTAIPLLKASRITVRAAIDHHGGGSNPSPATGLLTRVSRLDRGLLLALRNMVRRPARFWLSVSLLAAAGMVFVAGISLSASTQAITEVEKQRRTWDVDVQLAAPASIEEIKTTISGVPNIKAIDGYRSAATGLAGPGQIPITRTYPDQGHGRVAVTAIPAGATTFVQPEILEGRWLNPGETGAVVLNQVTRKNTAPGVRPGDTVQLLIGGKATTWRVVGLVQERMGGGGGVYATAEGLADATGEPQRVTQLRVVTEQHDEATRAATADAIAKTLAGAGIPVKSSASISRSEAISEGHLGPVILILLGIALPLGVVGVTGLASTMSANVLDRLREFGIMLAIGARPKAVRRIVIAEGVLLALTSCVIAIGPALVLTSILGSGLGNLFFSAPLPYRVSALAAGIWVVLAVLGAALATDAAATRASRLTVRETLTYL